MSDLVVRPWRQKMTARDTGEEHRAATALELFFDLCFVVAVAQAGGQLHHAAALVTGVILAALVAVSVVLAGGASAEA